MDKKIDLKKNCVLLFVLNILVFLSLILFKVYFTKMGYSSVLVNSALIINVILLVIGVIFNVLMFKNPSFCCDKKHSVIFVVIFIIYLFINTFGVVLINKPLNSGYTKIAEELSGYCESFMCQKYETVNDGTLRDFVINNSYLDYNGVTNEVQIHTKYDSKEVLLVEATIFSQNEMFSEELIKKQVEAYYSNFGVEVDANVIKQAFDNRFNGSIKKEKLTYKVSEVYDEDTLVGLKTTITLDLKQG